MLAQVISFRFTPAGDIISCNDKFIIIKFQDKKRYTVRRSGHTYFPTFHILL